MLHAVEHSVTVDVEGIDNVMSINRVLRARAIAEEPQEIDGIKGDSRKGQNLPEVTEGTHPQTRMYWLRERAQVGYCTGKNSRSAKDELQEHVVQKIVENCEDCARALYRVRWFDYGVYDDTLNQKIISHNTLLHDAGKEPTMVLAKMSEKSDDHCTITN